MIKCIVIFSCLVCLGLAYIPDQTFRPWSIENKFVPYQQDFYRAESIHSYDVKHYRVDLKLPMTSGAYDGHTLIKIVPQENNFDTFNLHFVNLVCDSVKRVGANLVRRQEIVSTPMT